MAEPLHQKGPMREVLQHRGQRGERH
jgi:hypothetical protein